MKLLKAILFLFGAYLVLKACTLYWTYFNFFDGDGIGIYLLGFEINDKVPIRHVPLYATAIATLGVILMLPMITRIFCKSHKIDI